MKKVLLRSVLVTLIVGVGFYIYYTLPNVSELKQKNPKTTALMELRDEEYTKKNIRSPRQQSWIPYGAVADPLKKAVLISEDAAFFSHKGIDFNELKASLKKDLETWSFSRGGSTITMQLAKNLYLNPSKNPLRKIKEVIIAWQLEQKLSKRRIFEIYLNVVEFGRNLYGAEAAARFYFDKSAAALDALESATLAALLPSPRNSRERNLLNRRNVILGRLASIGYLSSEEYQRVRALPLFHKVEEAAPLLPREDE